MKLSPVLATVVAGRQSADQEDRLVETRTAPPVICGGDYSGDTTLDITSPGYPNDYFAKSDCTWVLQHDCAESWTVTVRHFDVEYHRTCYWDKLSFAATDDEETFNFCGPESEDDSSSSSFSSYSGSSSEFSGSSVSGSSYDYEITSADGLPDGFTINGNEITIIFSSDTAVQRGGFDITVTANLADNCSAAARPPSQCFSYPNFNNRETAYWYINPTFDVAVPFSDFSQSVPLTQPCLYHCVDTAGCFKTNVHHDPQTLENTCELRGNRLDAQIGSGAVAINGRYCDDEGGRVWLDGKTVTRVYCLFRFPGSADNYLDYLNRNNPQMLEWTTVKRTGDNGEIRDNISSSSIWSFHVATNRHSDYGTWYTFVSTTYFRHFLPGSEELLSLAGQEEALPTRRRRDAGSESLFESIAREAAGQFVNDLDTAAEGATVLETEDPQIETEILEEVPQPQDIEFAAAFDEFFTLVRAAMDALPWQPAVPMLAKTKDRFNWMTKFSDAPCAEYAGTGVGYGDDYVAPTIDADNMCETIVSFHAALSGYFDDFVCLDRAAENPFGKYRMRNRMPFLLNRTKIIFNRFLNKLSCVERLDVEDRRYP